MTKSITLSRGLLAAALVAAVLGMAQANAGNGDRHQGPRQDRMEQRLEHLSAELELSDAQVVQVRDMFERVREQFPRGERAARSDQRPSDEEREARRAEHRAKHAQVEQFVTAEMSGILTAEQFERFEAMRAERQRQHKAHKKHGETKAGETL